MKYPFRIVLVAVAGLVIASCKVTVNTVAPIQTGTLRGHVDYWWQTPTTNPDSMHATVTILHTSFTAQTDSNGDFVFNKLPAGTYDFLFSKPGFGDLKTFGVQFTGGGDVYLQSITGHLTTLSQCPPWHVQSITVVDTTAIYGYNDSTGKSVYGNFPVLRVSGILSSELGKGIDRSMIVFVNVGDTVGPFPGEYVRRLNAETPSEFVSVGQRIDANLYNPLDGPVGTFYPSGTHLSIVAYGMSNTYGGYYDPSLPMGVYTAYNRTASNIVHHIVP